MFKNILYSIYSFRNLYLGTDPEETILAAFKVLDSDEKGVLNKNL